MNPVERVIDECKKKKIPISRLEKDCGFSNGYIRNLRSGSISAGRLQKIAEYLGVPYIYLLKGSVIFSMEDLFAGPEYYFPEMNITTDEREILRSYRKADDAIKVSVLKLLDITPEKAAEGDKDD